jgi:hypothetical protein
MVCVSCSSDLPLNHQQWVNQTVIKLEGIKLSSLFLLLLLQPRLHSRPPEAIYVTAASLARGEPFGHDGDTKRQMMIASKLATEASEDPVKMVVLGTELHCSCNCAASAPSANNDVRRIGYPMLLHRLRRLLVLVTFWHMLLARAGLVTSHCRLRALKVLLRVHCANC